MGLKPPRPYREGDRTETAAGGVLQVPWVLVDAGGKGVRERYQSTQSTNWLLSIQKKTEQENPTLTR